MTCQCEICCAIKEHHIRLQCVPNESRDYFEEIFEALLDTQFDNDYYKAIMNGEWPESVQILEQALQEAKEKYAARTSS